MGRNVYNKQNLLSAGFLQVCCGKWMEKVNSVIQLMSFFISIFGNKNIGMFIYGLILSPIPSVWIDGKADGVSELCDTTDEFFHYYFW